MDTVATETVNAIPQPKQDTISQTDSLGKKQGHWIFIRQRLSESGVGDYAILEEGMFENGERTGIWFCYGPNRQVKAVMLFRIDLLPLLRSRPGGVRGSWS